MGRRTSRAPSPTRRAAPAPSRAPPRAAPPPPRTAPPPQHTQTPAPMQQPQAGMMQQQPQQPGMMKQMLTTAGGVAMGSVAAHGIMGMMSGGSKDDGAQHQQQPPPPQQQYQPTQPVPQQNPCEWQMQEFLNCARTQSDISLCDAFNQQYKECQIKYGM